MKKTLLFGESRYTAPSLRPIAINCETGFAMSGIGTPGIGEEDGEWE